MQDGEVVSHYPHKVKNIMPYKNILDYKEYCKKRYIIGKKEIEKLKSNPCVDCGNSYPYYVMEFDHVPERGKKINNISCFIGNRSINSKTVQDELAKCDLVCANCHSIRTHNRLINFMQNSEIVSQ